MTREERNIKLKHYITCLKCEVSGKRCEPDCTTQFLAGNFGEIIENLEAISKIMEQQPCDDCISRQEAINCVTSNEFIYKIVEDIKSLPSVTPKEKTGKWIENAPEYQNIDPPYICSECGNMHLRKTNYCDQCGAKMVEPIGK